MDWIADYLEEVESYPVKSQVKPREVYEQLGDSIPTEGEPMTEILNDFVTQILPGITHWQHPSFFAYFPANSSYPSLLAEMLTAAMGAQCMSWETSPAAAELEEKVMQWLMKAMGIPDNWDGVIQSTASDATLCALLSARERHSQFLVNEKGLQQAPVYRVYGSVELHSSIEKDVKIAGLGRQNYVKIAADEQFSMCPEALAKAIESDLGAGFQPLCVVSALGTTSSTGVDPLQAIAKICQRHQLWLHVDAAYAGSALILPEKQHHIQGIELADSFVFNPHKWLFTNFDCSAYFVKDPASLVQTFEITPEYLKTGQDRQVNNYRDWGIPLGRRFRALKLWFVLRSYGLDQLQAKLRAHIQWAQELKEWVKNDSDFELMAPVEFGLVCFRYRPAGLDDELIIEQINARLLNQINDEGKLYLTQTRLKGQYVIRFSIGQTHTEQHHVQAGWQEIKRVAKEVASNFS